MKKVAIIGAGITGLTTAYYLKKNNIPFVIFEKSNRTGGVIQSKKINDFIIEKGPNTGVVANLVLAELLAEINKISPIKYANEKSKKRLIWKNNKWHSLPSGIVSAINTPLFSFTDKLKVLGEFFRKKGNFETESLADTVKRRLGASFLDYAIDPFVSGVYAGDANYLITKYAFPKLYNLEEKYGSFIKGSIALGKERNDTYKKKVTKKIFSFTNGLQEFPDILTEIIGEKNIRFNTEPQINFIKSNLFKIDDETFSHIVSTVKPHYFNKLLPFVNTTHIDILQKLKYADIIQASIGFKDWKGIDIDAFGGLVPSIENKNILGILFMSSQFNNRAPEKGAVFSVFLGGIKKTHFTEKNIDDLKHIIQNDFMDMMKLNIFKPDIFELTKHKFAIAQYGINYKQIIDTIKLVEQQYNGLFLAGSIKEGIGLADRVEQANKIASKITDFE